jgi:hypothetical protein
LFVILSRGQELGAGIDVGRAVRGEPTPESRQAEHGFALVAWRMTRIITDEGAFLHAKNVGRAGAARRFARHHSPSAVRAPCSARVRKV